MQLKCSLLLRMEDIFNFHKLETKVSVINRQLAFNNNINRIKIMYALNDYIMWHPNRLLNHNLLWPRVEGK